MVDKSEALTSGSTGSPINPAPGDPQRSPRTVMQIIDQNMLLPDNQVLQEVVQKHPLHPNLAGHVETVEVFLSECCEIPQECIEVEADYKVRLGLGRFSKNKSNFRYILYHEFGHVADRSRPEFKYSEQLKASLSDSERWRSWNFGTSLLIQDST